MTEKMQILTMLQDGKITAEEAFKLLNALGNNRETENKSNAKKPKWLKIKVFDPEDATDINFTLPIALVSVGANIGKKLASKLSLEFNDARLTNNDIEEILHIIESGEIGKIIEIKTEKGEKIEIVIE